MKTKKGCAIIFLILMAVFSFSNLLPITFKGQTVKLSGLTIIAGIAGFFIVNFVTKSKMEGLRIQDFFKDIKSAKVIMLMLMPALINVLTVIPEKIFFPGFLQHVQNRIDFLNPSKIIILIIELIIAALGEEIAWRAFFQKQTSKSLGFLPSAVLTSFLFAMCHFAFDNPLIVILDMAEIFINSIFYGLVFKETKNAWCSSLSHFLANLTAMILLAVLLR